jgi:hypothetical protein
MRNEPFTVQLPIENLESFKLYAHWLYTGTIPLPQFRKDETTKYFETLARLYILGEALLDTKFKNEVIGAIIATSQENSYWPIGRPVAIIYNGTLPGSPARRLMTDVCAFKFQDNDTSWTNEFDNCPKEFFQDVVRAMAKQRPSGIDSVPKNFCEGFADYYEETEPVNDQSEANN